MQPPGRLPVSPLDIGEDLTYCGPDGVCVLEACERGVTCSDQADSDQRVNRDFFVEPGNPGVVQCECCRVVHRVPPRGAECRRTSLLVPNLPRPRERHAVGLSVRKYRKGAWSDSASALLLRRAEE